MYGVARANKTLDRLLSKPRDFTWDELKTLLGHFDYELKTTGGSSRKFIHVETRATFMIHEPHPAHVLKMYQIQDVIRFLRTERQI